MDDKTPDTGGPPAREHSVRELDASAIKGLAHPVRLRLLELLDDHGPATATQLAARTGENTGSTSYHLRRLARHGFIEEAPERGKGKERWWRSRSFGFDGDRFRRDPDTAQAAEFVLAELVRQRSADLARWLEESLSTPREWTEATLDLRRVMRLTREELAGLVREVSQVIDAHHARAEDRDEDVPDTARVIVTFDAFPVGLARREAGE
ncbi:helix-turn-helix domain-containing protein [Planomonospora venezuelensis]|uniref:DNA-binding transcriptional ArsR family regulator n=1 Tax=Planomonospora venezuelensis TaxID=1999 RepID=A0A841CXA8_PLAVE|nr:helix-turn-helix domain-containing protein [Planomonospora venezuelensis]MBB5962561.1 DNA-binding transcriptional ArsR family regulator [Planomonospora venezuelensis]GIM99033.1 transcriptional regulator [Planomonospora venezuelensis]